MSENIEEENEYESNTEPEKAENEDYRNFKEEPGDDDGENRNPTERNSVFKTTLFIIKIMIGAGILNLPLIIKTYGLIGGILLGLCLTFVSMNVSYFLGRTKKITQRYSYAVYSKMMFGTCGSIILKGILVVLIGTLVAVQLIIFGEVLKGLSILFTENLSQKMLIVIIAIILLPFMFQKDVSGLSKFAYVGIICICIFYSMTVILFIHKFLNNELKWNEVNLFPHAETVDYFKCIGGYYNGIAYQLSYFSYYLPLKPRNNKNMLKASGFATLSTIIIYTSFGILFYLMYGNSINDSALKILQDEFKSSIRKKDTFNIVILVISFLTFLVNASVSSMTYFYFCKSHLIGVIKIIVKKFKYGKKEKEIELVEINGETSYREIKSDDQKENNEILTPFTENIITFLSYGCSFILSVTFEKIISIESFNGSTFSNLIHITFPCVFYLYFSKGSKFYLEKFLASVITIFGLSLIGLYFYFLF